MKMKTMIMKTMTTIMMGLKIPLLMALTVQRRKIKRKRRNLQKKS